MPQGGWLGTVRRFFNSNDASVNHVQVAVKVSLCTNIAIVCSMTFFAIFTRSLALLSALVENMVDLLVQGLLCYAALHSGRKKDQSKFPAGTSRFEPVAVVVAASVMMLVSVVFIENGTKRLIDGFVHKNPQAPSLSEEALSIAVVSITVKIFIVLYTKWVMRHWPSAAVDAIYSDNRNDTISNTFAVLAYVIASVNSDLWFIDPCGAIIIFLLIMVAWFRMGKEQMMQLVGVCASPDFISKLKELCRHHNHAMALDLVRAYHFGSKYLVELEVVVPGDMTVKAAHDIALQLQFKVEQLAEVERAFVHVDYKQREYDEHQVSHEEDALLTYAGYDQDEQQDDDNENEGSNAPHASRSVSQADERPTGAQCVHDNPLEANDRIAITIPTPRADNDNDAIPFQALNA